MSSERQGSQPAARGDGEKEAVRVSASKSIHTFHLGPVSTGGEGSSHPPHGSHFTRAYV